MRKLLVVIPDRVTDILVKGEYQPCYYNPGEYFDEVHLLLMNDDRPDLAALQPTVGRARVVVHNFPQPDFNETWGYRLFALRRWADGAVAIADALSPHLVRAYGHSPVTFAAAEIKRRLGIPFVVSLHGNPDVDYYRGRLARTFRQRLEGFLSRGYEVASLRAADMVLPVYSPIVPFLESIGVSRHRVVYNAVGQGLSARQSYGLDRAHVRALCVGRQEPSQKNPAAIIEAMAAIEGLNLDLVGDGPLHAGLVDLAERLGVASRITFHRALPNGAVLALMRQADLFVYQSDNYEISKGTMEAALAGLPIVLNRRSGGTASEISEGPFLLVADTAEGYRDGLRKVIENDHYREEIGKAAAAYARAKWDPQQMEEAVAEVYSTLAGERS